MFNQSINQSIELESTKCSINQSTNQSIKFQSTKCSINQSIPMFNQSMNQWINQSIDRSNDWFVELFGNFWKIQFYPQHSFHRSTASAEVAPKTKHTWNSNTIGYTRRGEDCWLARIVPTQYQLVRPWCRRGCQWWHWWPGLPRTPGCPCCIARRPRNSPPAIPRDFARPFCCWCSRVCRAERCFAAFWRCPDFAARPVGRHSRTGRCPRTFGWTGPGNFSPPPDNLKQISKSPITILEWNLMKFFPTKIFFHFFPIFFQFFSFLRKFSFFSIFFQFFFNLKIDRKKNFKQEKSVQRSKIHPLPPFTGEIFDRYNRSAGWDGCMDDMWIFRSKPGWQTVGTWVEMIKTFQILVFFKKKSEESLSIPKRIQNKQNRSINQSPINQSLNRPINQSINQSIVQSINQSINCPINQSINRMFLRITVWWLCQPVSDRFIDLLVDFSF